MQVTSLPHGWDLAGVPATCIFSGMRPTLILAALSVIAAACSEGTPPIRNAVVHDLRMSLTGLQGDFNSYGIRETRPLSGTFAGSLVVDFGTQGAMLDFPDAQPACLVRNGRLTLSGAVVNGQFEASGEGPVLTLTGTMDADGKMSGSFQCQSRRGSPHYDMYLGTYVATRRP